MYNALLGCLHRLQNKENGSEPPKQEAKKETKKSEVRNNRLSSDSVWCVCTCVHSACVSFACQLLMYYFIFIIIYINYYNNYYNY